MMVRWIGVAPPAGHAREDKSGHYRGGARPWIGGRMRVYHVREAVRQGAGVTVVDAHHHVWDLATTHYGWMDQARWDSIRRNYGMDGLRPAVRCYGLKLLPG